MQMQVSLRCFHQFSILQHGLEKQKASQAPEGSMELAEPLNNILEFPLS